MCKARTSTWHTSCIVNYDNYEIHNTVTDTFVTVNSKSYDMHFRKKEIYHEVEILNG